MKISSVKIGLGRLHAFPFYLALVNFFIVISLFKYMLTIYPSSGDEYSLLFQAQIFSLFKLWATVPSMEEFFPSHWVEMAKNHHWFSIYAPGYPFLLVPGVWLKAPYLMPALFSSVIVLLVYFLIFQLTEHLWLTRLSTAVFSLSPMFLFMSSTYYVHTGTKLMFLACLLLLINVLREGSRRQFFVLGAAIGAGYLIRPYTFLPLSLPILFAAAMQFFRRGREERKRLAIALVLPVAASCLALWLYNFALSGTPFETPQLRMIKPSKQLSVENVNDSFRHRIPFALKKTLEWVCPLTNPTRKTFDFNNATDLDFTSAAFALIVLGAIWALRRQSGWRRGVHGVLIVAAFALVTAYSFCRYFGGVFGERFFHEIIFILAYFLCCGVFALFGWLRNERVFGAVILLIFICAEARTARLIFPKIEAFRSLLLARSRLYIELEKLEEKNGLIFISDSVPGLNAAYLVRNRPDLSGNIFVLDLAQRNHRLMSRFPGRTVYFYSFKRGLVRLSSNSVAKN